MTEDKPRLQPKNNESSLGNNHKPIAGYKDLIEMSESDKDIYIKWTSKNWDMKIKHALCKCALL